MNKFGILLGISSSLFLFNLGFAQQDSVSTADLLKRIEKLEAEQKKPKEWDASLYGWVRAEYNFDSRQSAYAREYQLNLYPLDEKLDANGKEINDAGASNFLAITSRVGINFRGPDVWGAKASGKIEADFFGNTEQQNCCRNRKHRTFKTETCHSNFSLAKNDGNFWANLVSYVRT